MNSDDLTPEPPRLDRPSPGGPDEFPDWVRQLEREIRVGRAVRLRIWFGRHARKLLAGVAALLVLALLGYLGPAGYRYARRPAEPARAYPTVSPPAGIQATTTASPRPTAGPFDGTPAAAFPEGAAGITLPPAKATGDFTAKQVSAALTKIRTALVTARLDRAFMTAKDPERLIRQFAPDHRPAIRDDFRTGAFAHFATRLAPGARLLPDQPRVKGRITYRTVRDDTGVRVLEVTTNFVWAYAFHGPGVAPGDGVAVVHDTLVWRVPHPADVRSSASGLWFGDMRAYGANVNCAAFDKGLLDVGEWSNQTPLATPAPDPDSLYDPDHTLDVPDTCGLRDRPAGG
ncbi:hypothetical protein DLE60_26070 [Micromonospora globispora]|uniref:Uncharacterized protein n=1 Tax=Micromonospora globispora TaxID=1450148 RepID=A0A317KHU7_9ACTN|nr:hypothetical protein [Micromonospora globispora]PWU52900.1 hypothetical protein DLJ46_02120 [Micromonospora globispora]PWU56545.1 hypothetical protein DLE60_26070 [Micromonospora globispora]